MAGEGDRGKKFRRGEDFSGPAGQFSFISKGKVGGASLARLSPFAPLELRSAGTPGGKVRAR